jgi:sugar-specific transcriptional regulator TrmB
LKEKIAKLQELGLSKREAEIYLALLSKKELSAAEIAKITSVSRTKSYEMLQNLVKRKVCNERFKNGVKVFSGVEPDIAIQNLLSVYEDELNAKKKLAEKFRDELIEQYNIKEKINDPLDYIEVLSDVRQIRDRWLTIQKNTKRELLVFTKPPYSVSLEENIEEESEVLTSQVVGKGIYEYKGITSPEDKNNLRKMLMAYQKIGEQVRLIEELPMKLVISDETIAMFALNDRVSLKPSITTMIIDHPSFAAALKKVFESYWAAAISIEDFQ